MAWDWLKASDAFKRCRNKHEGRKVAKHTYIRPCGRDERGENIYEMRYCGTSLVRWHPNGTLQVQTAGWDTNTTRRRIDSFAGVSCEKIRSASTTTHLFANSRSDALRYGAQVVDDGEWVTLQRTDTGKTFWAAADGQPVAGRLEGVANRKRAAKRDPFSKLCRGDVMKKENGDSYIVVNWGAGTLRLVRYYGDPAPDVARVEYLDSTTITDLFHLSMRAGGWTVGERFEGGK
jgi:hypothetical protein